MLWTTNGAPPTAPTAQCRFENAEGGYFIDPSWHPDGTALVWEEGDVDADTPPAGNEGLWTIDGVGDGPCPSGTGQLLVPGGAQADWGPADINPGARPASSSSGGNNSGSSNGSNTGTSTNTNTTTTTTTTTTTVVNGTDTLAPTVRLAIPRQRLGKVLKKGYAVGLITDEAGAGSATLVASGRDAAGLKVTAAKKVTVAKGSKRFRAAGKQKLVLKFTRKARKKLARKRSLKLTLTVKVVDGANNGATTTKRITLKR
jgi:hypothetical protein